MNGSEFHFLFHFTKEYKRNVRHNLLGHILDMFSAFHVTMVTDNYFDVLFIFPLILIMKNRYTKVYEYTSMKKHPFLHQRVHISRMFVKFSFLKNLIISLAIRY